MIGDRPDLSGLPVEVVAYIEALEAAIQKAGQARYLTAPRRCPMNHRRRRLSSPSVVWG